MDSKHLAEYLPKLLFCVDRQSSKTYKEIIKIGVQVEMLSRPNVVTPYNQMEDYAPLQKSSEFKQRRHVKKIPPISDLKDIKITLDNIQHLIRNVFNEALIMALIDDINNQGELDRFRLDFKELIVKQYKDARRYSHAVSYLERETKFTIYSGDQTYLFIIVKTMIEYAKRLRKYVLPLLSDSGLEEREIERDRLLSCLLYFENHPTHSRPSHSERSPVLIKESIQNDEKVTQEEPKESKTVTISEKPMYPKQDSKSSIEDDDTVVISEEQLTPERHDLEDSVDVEDENGFFLTKSTATHYKKWNKLFSKAKPAGMEEEDFLNEKADEFRREHLKRRAVSALKVYKDRRKELRAHLGKKRKLKNIKARSFYVRSLQTKAFASLKENMERRQNCKRAIRILRNVRYQIIKKKFFNAWQGLLLRCSEIPTTFKEKPKLYDSDSAAKKVEPDRSSGSKKHYRKLRPQSAGGKRECRNQDVADPPLPYRHRYNAEPVIKPREKNREKKVLLLSTQKVDKDFVFTPEMIKNVQKGIREAEQLLARINNNGKLK